LCGPPEKDHGEGLLFRSTIEVEPDFLEISAERFIVFINVFNLGISRFLTMKMC
jgi:hypothetical protein